MRASLRRWSSEEFEDGVAHGGQLFVTPVSIKMVTLAGLEPATSPAPGENKDAHPPLSYSVVTILMTVCGGARADNPARRPKSSATI